MVLRKLRFSWVGFEYTLFSPFGSVDVLVSADWGISKMSLKYFVKTERAGYCHYFKFHRSDKDASGMLVCRELCFKCSHQLF